jgi:hypothetical protein
MCLEMHRRRFLVAVLGEPDYEGNVRESAASRDSEPGASELIILHEPVQDVEQFLPGHRHFMVWYCSGGADAFLNCIATGNAERDEWVLRRACPLHKNSF